MGHASFDTTWAHGITVSPELQVLEVRNRENPDGPAISYFLVERRERTRATDKWATADATIHITYREISTYGYTHSAARGEFTGSYHAHVNTVSLTSGSLTGGGVFIDPPSIQGNRLGTYLMNEIVKWAKRWPEATVNTISLLEGQSHGDNKERRNRFYEQFGVTFEYTSADRKVGTSLPMLAQDLTPVDSWEKNIYEHNLLEFLSDTLYRKKIAEGELVHRTRAVKELYAEQKRIQGRPIRWALMQHIRTIFWAAGGAVVTYAAWLKYLR